MSKASPERIKKRLAAKQGVAVKDVKMPVKKVKPKKVPELARLLYETAE